MLCLIKYISDIRYIRLNVFICSVFTIVHYAFVASEIMEELSFTLKSDSGFKDTVVKIMLTNL